MSKEYEFFPYLDGAAWPVMRGDLQNTGRGRFLEWTSEAGTVGEPVHFHTGNGVFSTPVIDARDRIYVGSADHHFYALDPASGMELWKYRTGEIIDSAAALGKDNLIYVPSGDSKIHALDMDGRAQWVFDVLKDRPRKLSSASTCFWWEGNVVTGPDGRLYAGNDDFFFYCLENSGEMRWAFRAGFFFWSAAAFDKGDTVYVPSFDMRLYALDLRTGKPRWKRTLGNALISSPAIGDDGVLYQGCMNGRLYALCSETGHTLWTAETGGHIYASAAVGTDNVVYITSTDGALYAFDGACGKLSWTFHTGEALRASPVLGPDPEGRASYLVYFGGGNGQVYCIEPQGKRRWSYDTLSMAGEYVEYPNINASPALGRTGFAVASASGDVIWIPYGYYLKEQARGITCAPEEGFGAEAVSWHYVTPGGRVDRTPLTCVSATTPMRVHAGSTVSLKVFSRRNQGTVPVSIVPGSVRIQVDPDAAFSTETQGNGAFLSLIPECLLEPDIVYTVNIAADYTDGGGLHGTVSGSMCLLAPGPAGETPVGPANRPFEAGIAYEITHMAIPLPPIVPSLDQIGLASLTIPFSIVDYTPETGAFTAWGVQSFGESREGDLVGVPDSRTLFYAFGGHCRQDTFTMTSRNGHFEVTGFPMPLDTLRFAGRLDGEGNALIGASLYTDTTPPGGLSGAYQLYQQIFSVSGEENGGQRNWIGDLYKKVGFFAFVAAMQMYTAACYRMMTKRIWSAWGFLNGQGKFVGTGTFRMRKIPAPAPVSREDITVQTFDYDARRRQVTAEIAVKSKDNPPRYVTGIVLIDIATGHPLPINYNLSTFREKVNDNKKRVTLTLPKNISVASRKIKAVLMVNLMAVSSVEFQ